ncbi:hypothetical protein QWZ13_03660 [Reinekea marina]|uniref:hypothetical protein n=1 Tax=Reinekea marina TaxID=1310421 RepID=UPI0025B282CE|nr:hypothetical protein [Reinekea marina]MDN3648002.1 hypothetical protein [Reinekea marina]
MIHFNSGLNLAMLYRHASKNKAQDGLTEVDFTAFSVDSPRYLTLVLPILDIFHQLNKK